MGKSSGLQVFTKPTHDDKKDDKKSGEKLGLRARASKPISMTCTRAGGEKDDEKLGLGARASKSISMTCTRAGGEKLKGRARRLRSRWG